jgi:hypothetical protein
MPDLGGLLQNLKEKFRSFVDPATGLPTSGVFSTAPVVVWQVDLGACPGQHRYWRRLDDYTISPTSHIQNSDDGVTWTDVLTGGIVGLPTSPTQVEAWLAQMAADALGWLTHHFHLEQCPIQPVSAPAPTIAAPPSPVVISPDPAGNGVSLSDGSEPVSNGVAYRLTVLWEDALGVTRLYYYDAPSIEKATNLLNALETLSNALPVQYWIGLLQGTGGDVAGTVPYASVEDVAAILADAGVSGDSAHSVTLNVPAPIATLFQPDQTALDPTNGTVTAAYAAIVANALSYQQAPVQRVIVGFRDSHGPGGRT